MLNLLEITGDDIARLDDIELRTLIGRLCEADYRLAGLPTKGITWGGNQDASDGGLDVVVRDEVSPPGNSFVPRSISGFQVKKSDMPRAEIIKEMRPKDVLREAIKALIQKHGAYIIVSSNGSTTDTALKKRITAMKEAVADVENHQNLHLDFLDRGRVATWIRSHPSMILWVRNKIGRPLKGWRPYENWANAPGGIKEEYILDGAFRLHDGSKPTDKGLSVDDGLLKLRSALSIPGTSIRLTGLSGVGKTRFIQAVFDERVGNQALNPSQALYTDISDSPAPDPNTLANQLITDKTREILIIDNCPSDLHHRLTKTCSKPQSTVSLLTVEYDVRDDLPEETSVFRLEPASEEVIKKLIRKRFPHISQVDARTIASFSGGNARVAIALANTMQQGETLSDFRNEELFERLFWQRHDPNESLLISAEACSLVYSFEGTDASSENSELQLLASLVDKSGADLFRSVVELKKRDLIQSRSVWRAVLPHAIANRLAKRALESIPKDTIVRGFINSGSDRLIRSFTHRLSYLHDCDTAIEIVNDWLGQDGWIGKSIDNLNSLGIDILKNIAPVSPEKTLDAIERAANGPKGSLFTSRENSHNNEFVQLLRHLAYDPVLFDRSLKLMCRYALSESKDEDNNSIRDVLKSLFYISLSGTHAPMEARASIIEEMVDSKDQDKQELGFLLLDTALETWYFSSSHEFRFGARPRDYGYNPKTREEVTHWFETFIGICTRLTLSDQPIAEQTRKLLAYKLRDLWTVGGMYNALEESARQIHGQRAWNDGWMAVRGIIRYDRKDFKEEIMERLLRLEKLLKPIDLLEQARTYALSDQHQSFDLEDDFDDDEDASEAWHRLQEATRKIGARVAQSIDTLNTLLPALVSTNNARLYSFGRGLADGCSDKQELLQILRAELEKTPPEERQIDVVLGFLSTYEENDPLLYNSTLDELINDDVLGEWFPVLQINATMDQRGLERLHVALDLGKADIHKFQYLAFGRAHESIDDDELSKLLKKILSREGGIDVVIKILQMRFHPHGRDKKSMKYSDNLIAVTQDMLSMYTFDKNNKRQRNHDYVLATIVRICLKGQGGIPVAKKFGRHFAKSIIDYRISAYDYQNLLKSLAQAQPMVFLDVFLGRNDVKEYQRKRIFCNDMERRGNPLNLILDNDLLSWCEDDPFSRYSLVASVMKPFKRSDVTGKLEWKSIVYDIFERAPNLFAVLEHLANTTRPMAWSGSLSNILQERSILFQELYEHENTKIRDWAINQYSNLKKTISKERELENQRFHERNESFE